MAVLEQVMRMKNQGITESDIINQLSQQGLSPKEITDALRQAQIKSAVSSDYGNDMQQSVMPENEIPSPSQNENYQPDQQQYSQQYTQPEEYQPQEPQQEQYYAPRAEAGYAPQPSGIDTDTVMEIADQVFTDKVKKVQTQLDAVSEAAIVLQTKTENVSERLKKIEEIIDKLQIAILEKVGSYGQNLESIKKEMSMMQDSFSKMISPSREIKKQQNPEEYRESEESNQRRIPRKK